LVYMDFGWQLGSDRYQSLQICCRDDSQMAVADDARIMRLFVFV